MIFLPFGRANSAAQPKAAPLLRDALRRWLLHRRGVAALELGFVIFPMFVLVLGIFELGFDFYAQQSLDYALYTAVRQVATGSIQGSANSLATFQSVAFCPAISGLLDCPSISVSVTPVPAYSSAAVAVPMTGGSFDPSGFKYCPGQPSQLMIAQAVYPAPTFIGHILPIGVTSYNGSSVRLISSVAGFVNEPYTASAATPSGC